MKIKYYEVQNKETILNYIKINFNISNQTYLLIDSLFDFLKNRFISLTSEQINENLKIYYHEYLYQLIILLNDCNIDINILELINNNIAIEKKSL